MMKAVIFSSLLMLTGCTMTKEDIHQDSEIIQTDTENEENNHSSLEVTLYVWSDADQENKSYTDTSAESIQVFTELYDLLYNQKEDTEDIVVMGKEGFDSIHDGIITYKGQTISFLNDRVTWNNEVYENAWYIELITLQPYQTNYVIFPEGSNYIPMLKRLLNNLHFRQIKEP